MVESRLHSDPRTVARYDSVACILEWTSSMSLRDRQSLLAALAERNDAVRHVVVPMMRLIKDPGTAPAEREHALRSIYDALFPDPRPAGATGSMEESFADRLRELMTAKRVTQQELAERVGCSQPAISQLLSRQCRPRKQTIVQLAEALKVPAQELWPEIDVADMLDAVAEFQQDNYTMTEEEAAALSASAKKNRPGVSAKRLPTRE